MRKDRLLMLDDDEELAQSLKRYFLTRGGWEFEHVCETSACLEAIERFAPDALILDCNLGKNDREGLEFLKFLRSRRRYHELGILMLTGARRKTGQLVEGFNLGASQYMLKPASPRALEARLAMLLRSIRLGAFAPHAPEGSA